MNSAQVNVNVSISGAFKGSTINNNPDVRSPVSLNTQQALTQGGTTAGLLNQAIDLTKADQTILAATTTSIDLRDAGTSYKNPVGEQITSTNNNQFGKVRVLKFQHSSASTATLGIKLFGSSTDTFSGYLPQSTTCVVKPGESVLLESYTTAGMTVDATHRLFTFANLDAVPAQFRLFIGGSTN